MIMYGFPEKMETMRASIGFTVEKVSLVLFAQVRLRELPKGEEGLIFALNVNPAHLRCGFKKGKLR